MLTREAPVVVASRDHWLGRCKAASLSSLCEEKWVFPGRDISVRYVDRLTALCIDHGFSPLVRHEVSSTMQQIAYASCGQGLALVPEFFASLLPDSVVAVRLTDVEPCIELSMVWDETTPNAVRDRAIEIARSVSS